MALGVNKVILVGNVGSDPVIRYFDVPDSQNQQNNQQYQNNNKVAHFSIATSERFRDRQGVQQERTEWHNIVAWRWLADIVERFVVKGTQLYVEGSLRTSSWTDANNQTRYTTEVVADNIQLLGRKSDNPAVNPQSGYNGIQSQQTVPQQGYNASAQGNNAFVQGGYNASAQGNNTPQQGYNASQPANNATQNAQNINFDDGMIDISNDDGVEDLPF